MIAVARVALYAVLAAAIVGGGVLVIGSAALSALWNALHR